jgi:hypothetical protein
MIPAQALLIALFLDFKRLNLLQNLLGLIIVYSAQALPVSIWMLRNFVATIPRELGRPPPSTERAASRSSGGSCSRSSHPDWWRPASSRSSPRTTSSSSH